MNPKFSHIDSRYRGNLFSFFLKHARPMDDKTGETSAVFSEPQTQITHGSGASMFAGRRQLGRKNVKCMSCTKCIF